MIRKLLISFFLVRMVDVTRNDLVELTTRNGKHNGTVLYFNKNKETNDYEIKLKDVKTESGRTIRAQRFKKSQITDLKTLTKVRNAEDLPAPKTAHWITDPGNTNFPPEIASWSKAIGRKEKKFFLGKYEIVDNRVDLTSTLVKLKSSSQLSVSFEVTKVVLSSLRPF